jgi:pimeloyl-ACP methyl ester carboxylesterase
MIIFLTIIIIFIVLYCVGGRRAAKWFPDEVHFLPLPGGRRLVLHRLRPGGDTKREHPVILCHGLGANRFNLALPGTHSLAEHLSRQGYDVFCVELSGFGMSTPLGWRHKDRYKIVFDDYVDRDGPAAIEYVLAQTGAESVFWAGHSMGGMVGLSLAQFEIAGKMRGVVALASPGSPYHLTAFKKLLPIAFLRKVFPKISQGVIARTFSPIIQWLPDRVLESMIRPVNVDLSMLKSVAANVLSDTPTTLLYQFGEWVRDGEIKSYSGYSYQANYGRVTIPVCLFAGKADFFAAPPSVEFVFNSVGSADRTYVLFSKESGGLSDYGHGDMIFGRTAPQEVFERVSAWMNERDHAEGLRANVRRTETQGLIKEN